MATLSKLGPFTVDEVNEPILTMVAVKKVPIILCEDDRYAILVPPDRETRLVCAGCFKPGMTLKDDGRCRAIISFFHHTKCDKEGVRVHPCKDGHDLQDIIDRNKDNIPTLARAEPVVQVNVGDISSYELAQEVVARGDHETLLSAIDDDDLAKAVGFRGMKLLYDAREAELKHELRRLTHFLRPTVGDYYGEKKPGMPHVSDYPLYGDVDLSDTGYPKVKDTMKRKASMEMEPTKTRSKRRYGGRELRPRK